MPQNGDCQHAEPRVLIVDTSHRVGLVVVASGEHALGLRCLDEARRHARDLVPAIQHLLAEQHWRARDLDAVFVSRGPGSYTGLRVGIMSAKTLAYATGCTLLGLETFAAIARQAPAEALTVDVIADAQQNRVYIQRFTRSAAVTTLSIQSVAAWRATLTDANWVTGPGLERYPDAIGTGVHVAPPETWFPRSESLLQLGLERLRRGEKDDVFAVEPLYLRASSAEEKWSRG